MLKSIQEGAAACWTLNNLAPRILKSDYQPGFLIEHFVKDIEIALEESKRMNLNLPGLVLVHQLYNSLKIKGEGQLGTQALIRALEDLNKIEIRK